MATREPHSHERQRPTVALSVRQLLPAWTALVGLAAFAWVVTIRQAAGMGIGPGALGLALPLFLGMWVTMMAAMMFPSVAPIAILWSRTIVARSSGAERASRIAQFVAGYLLAWVGYGLLAFGALLLTARLVDASPGTAKWLGISIFTAAGLYQLTPMKDACLRHCRSPMMALLHYGNYKGRLRDLRVGTHHGLYCVGCCWGLMIVLVAVGVMNVAAMAALAAVILLEKLWSRGRTLSRLVGVAFIVIAVLAVFFPEQLLPALKAAQASTDGMGSARPPMS